MPKEHAAKKATEKSEGLKQAKSNIRCLKECIPSVAKSVTLNGKLQVPFSPDSGADRTYLSRYHGMKLLDSDPTASFYDLPEPVISMAVGGNELISRQAMRVNIMITTAAGIVTISEPWECLFLDCAECEMILGVDLLSTLGINVDNQLERLAARDSCANDDALPFKEDDRTKTPDNQELKQAMEELLVNALANGFPQRLLDDLRRLVFMFDIWRIALGRYRQHVFAAENSPSRWSNGVSLQATQLSAPFEDVHEEFQ